MRKQRTHEHWGTDRGQDEKRPFRSIHVLGSFGHQGLEQGRYSIGAEDPSRYLRESNVVRGNDIVGTFRGVQIIREDQHNKRGILGRK